MIGLEPTHLVIIGILFTFLVAAILVAAIMAGVVIALTLTRRK